MQARRLAWAEALHAALRRATLLRAQVLGVMRRYEALLALPSRVRQHAKAGDYEQVGAELAGLGWGGPTGWAGGCHVSSWAGFARKGCSASKQSLDLAVPSATQNCILPLHWCTVLHSKARGKLRAAPLVFRCIWPLKPVSVPTNQVVADYRKARALLADQAVPAGAGPQHAQQQADGGMWAKLMDEINKVGHAPRFDTLCGGQQSVLARHVMRVPALCQGVHRVYSATTYQAACPLPVATAACGMAGPPSCTAGG